MTRPYLRNTLLALATVGSLGTITACGSGSNGTGDASEPLNVGQISDSVAFFPLYVAEEQGYFEDEGVTLGERPRMGTGAKLAAALTSGSIDIGAGVITDAFNMADSDPNARITGALVTEYYVDVIVGSDFDGPPADAPLEEKIRALEGKNIGITGPGSGTEALLVYLFDQVGLDVTTDATLVNLGAVPSGAIGALSSGQVDALSFFQPVGQMVETQDVGQIYISPQRGDVPDMAEQLHGVTFSTAGVIEEKAEQVEGFNRAIDSALGFIDSNPEETTELLTAYLEGTDEATIEALMPIVAKEMATTTAISGDAYDKAVNFHTESGLLEQAPEADEIIWEKVRG